MFIMTTSRQSLYFFIGKALPLRDPMVCRAGADADGRTGRRVTRDQRLALESPERYATAVPEYGLERTVPPGRAASYQASE